MKDREWCKRIEDEIDGLKDRVKKLEGGSVQDDPNQKIIELDLVLPEDDIDGLHFNAQGVHAVFEKKEDGAYYSRDILFLSARDTDEGTGRDLLSEYLNKHEHSGSIKAQIALAMKASRVPHVEVFLPEENQGVKRYNGVTCWYWLQPRYSGSAAYFCAVDGHGYTHTNFASAVGGCAPAFRVGENRHG
jgi:hypothetical protein